MKRPILLFALFAAVIAGCTPKTPPTVQDSNSRKNGNQPPKPLVIAILPTIDCIPFHVASQQGIFDSLGLNVKTVVYQSQMDAEQSVINGKSIGCATDLFRTALLQSQKAPLRYLFSTNREWELIANKKLRISKISQLNDRIIGITRHSTIDFLSDFLTTQLKKDQLILRSQINNVDTRLQMLENAQIDAAFLPVQRAFSARKRGHTLLPVNKSKYDRLSGFAVSAKWTASKENLDKARLISKGYDMAVAKLQKGGKSVLSKTDLQRFRLNGCDSLIQKRQSFANATTATAAQTELVLKWLKGRNAIAPTFHADTLLFK